LFYYYLIFSYYLTNGATPFQIIASAFQNPLLYAAPIWAGAMKYERNVNTVLGPQRRIALRIAMAYRTVSTAAVMVVAGIIPAHLMANEKQARYRRKKEGLEGNKKEDQQQTYQEWQREWNSAQNGRWTWMIIRDVEKWTLRKFGETDIHLTQILTGYGCFGGYLSKY